MPEQELPAGRLARHRHRSAYAAVVLAGEYLEWGDRGRWRVRAGDVVAHGVFEAHGDLIGSAGATVVNIELPAALHLPPVFRVESSDELVRAARQDATAAVALLQPVAAPDPLDQDWPDLLARTLRERPVAIGGWAREAGLAPATISRGFRAAFGTTPARYRAEAQARAALHQIVGGHDGLADIAQLSGFADQAHLCRAIVRLTGRTPSAWRQVKSVQDGDDRPH